MAAVAARESEVIEQPRNTLIEHGAIVTAGLVAERRGEPALADACRAADQQVGMVVDPASLDKLGKQWAVEAARSGHPEPQLAMSAASEAYASGEASGADSSALRDTGSYARA